MIKEKLTIRELAVRDCWKDMARIPGTYRGRGRSRIHRNTICKVTIGGQQKLLVIRGWGEGDDAIIAIDSSTRDDLGVNVGRAYDVTLTPLRWFNLGYWRWAWGASDTAYRIASRISIISLFLGMIGLILGIIGFVSKCR